MLILTFAKTLEFTKDFYVKCQVGFCFLSQLKLKLKRKYVCVLILIQVPYVDLEHQGTYWCRVYNERDSQDSRRAEVIIGKQY